MSTAQEAELLSKDKPSWLTAEVTPQHLLLNTSASKDRHISADESTVAIAPR